MSIEKDILFFSKYPETTIKILQSLSNDSIQFSYQNKQQLSNHYQNLELAK